MIHLFYIGGFGLFIYSLIKLINRQTKLIRELGLQNEKLLEDLRKEKQEKTIAQEELKTFIETFDSTLMKEEEIREQVLQDFQSEVEAILLKDMMKRMKNVGEA